MGGKDSETIRGQIRRNDASGTAGVTSSCFGWRGCLLLLIRPARDLDQIASICVQSQNLTDVIPMLPI